ncbi:MAG: hypothetical protein R6U04_12110 [Bacteroidales bacterium]
MQYNFVKIIFSGLFIVVSHFTIAQYNNENTLMRCDDYLHDDYISSGQDYTANLNKNNKAVFHTTFYGGTQYRIIACSNIEKYPLILEVYDTERNLIFSNSDHDYIPYWDLLFTSTVTSIVEISIDTKQNIKKPVKLLIGFKRSSLNLD